MDFKAIAARSGMCPAAAMLDPEEAVDGGDSGNRGGSGYAFSRRPRAGASHFAYRTADADASESLFEAGLPRGQMLECVCAGASVGGQSLLECFLQAPWESGVFNALVDTAQGLDPESLCRGLETRLLWVPVENAHSLIRALDILLRDENFGLVAADLRGLRAAQLREIQPFAWYRLQRLAHQRPGGCLLLSERPSVRCADRRLLLDQPRHLSDLDRRRVDLLAAVEGAARLRNRGQLTGMSDSANLANSSNLAASPDGPVAAVG